MAAPATTVRVTPSGFKMPDGFRTLIAFSANASVQLWEVQLKAPAIDGGNPIETTTMHNVAWRTKAARHLKSLDPFQFMAMYDPDVLAAIFSLINAEGSITVKFPDLSTLDFFGYLQKFEPGELKEGERPEASCMVCPTNWDPVNFVEQGPVFTPNPAV